MALLQGASFAKLNAAVERLKREGMPKPVDEEKFLATQSEEIRSLVAELKAFAARDHECSSRPILTLREKNDHAVLRREALRKFQDAVVSGLLCLRIVQIGAPHFGAIPAAHTNWMLCVMPDGSYRCWSCGVSVRGQYVPCGNCARVHWETPLI